LHLGPTNDDSGLKPAPDTRPKPVVFVLMPFAAEFDDTYHLGIFDTCQAMGLNCQRADEQMFDGTILDNIYAQIARADVIVAEMSGRNANVFYETGYAHALGKQVILLTREATDIPFDLSQYPHIVYERRITYLKVELEKRLRWVVENPSGSLARVEQPLSYWIAGKKLENRPVITYQFRENENVQYIEVELAMHNDSTRLVQPGQAQVAVVTPPDVVSANNTESRVQLPDGRFLFALKPLPIVFPDGWYSVTLGLVKGARQNYERGVETEFAVRCYTELGKRDFPFAVRVENRVEEAGMQARP